MDIFLCFAKAQVGHNHCLAHQQMIALPLLHAGFTPDTSMHMFLEDVWLLQ
jgi:hypothetical protein